MGSDSVKGPGGLVLGVWVTVSVSGIWLAVRGTGSGLRVRVGVVGARVRLGLAFLVSKGSGDSSVCVGGEIGKGLGLG